MFPSLVEVFGSWRDITRFSPGWLAAMAGLQAATLACMWALQHVALRAKRWRPVIASQLAGNALSKIAPGGGAMGAALQYKMLVRSGQPPAATVTALTAVNVLMFAVVLAMPVLAIPALLRGRVDETLLDTALIGLAVFVGGVRAGRDLSDDRPSTEVGRPHRAARPQPAAPQERAAAGASRSACCASATGCSGRSDRSGSARCWPPSGAGRSTTAR